MTAGSSSQQPLFGFAILLLEAQDEISRGHDTVDAAYALARGVAPDKLKEHRPPLDHARQALDGLIENIRFDSTWENAGAVYVINGNVTVNSGVNDVLADLGFAPGQLWTPQAS